MRRTLFCAVIAALAACCMLFACCVDTPEAAQLNGVSLPPLQDGQMAVVVKNGPDDYSVYPVDLTAELTTAEAVINHLAQSRNLYVDWQQSAYGKYLNGIGGARVQTGQYLAVYTSDASQQSVGAGATCYRIGDVTVGYAQVGISQLAVSTGTVLYFELVEL